MTMVKGRFYLPPSTKRYFSWRKKASSESILVILSRKLEINIRSCVLNEVYLIDDYYRVLKLIDFI